MDPPIDYRTYFKGVRHKYPTIDADIYFILSKEEPTIAIIEMREMYKQLKGHAFPIPLNGVHGIELTIKFLRTVPMIFPYLFYDELRFMSF